MAKSKHVKWSPKVQAKFLKALAETGLVTKSAEVAGVTARTCQLHRKADAEFSELWSEALEVFRDGLEAEAYRRAVKGWDEPVFYQGEETGTVRKFSDRLLELLLKANVSDKYRDKVKVDADVQVGGVLVVPRAGQAEEPE